MLGFNLNSHDVQAASSGTFTEDFTTTSYMDSYNTNVSRWGSGEIELPRKNPIYQDLLKVSTTGNSIIVDGEDYAYIGGAYDGLYILDVSSPDAMTLEGYYNDSAEINWVYGCDLYMNRAYLANGQDGLLILDVTNKAAPTKLGEIDLYQALDVEVLITHAYVACGSGGIRAIDVSNPSAPFDAAGYINCTSDANGLARSDDLLFVAAHHGGLDVFNISTLASPVFISNIDLDGYAKKVEVKNNCAYVACDLGGLQIVDFSDPTNMTRVAWVGDNTRYHGIDIQDNYVFVTGKSGMDDYKLDIYSIADPTDPIPAGVYVPPNVGQDVFVSGDYAYVMASTHGVLSLQIADGSGYFGSWYQMYAEAYSSGVYYAPAGEIIDRAMLSSDDLDGPQATISYYLSADGGGHWEAVDVDVMHYFTYTGQSLRWKAELASTSEGISPRVYEVEINYYTEDVGIDLLYPAQGEYILDQTPNLDWSDVAGAMGYLLQVSDSSNFRNLLVNESLIMHVSNYTLTTPLDFGGYYYWRVAYYIDFDTISVFSDYNLFIIDNDPMVGEFGISNTILLIVSIVGLSSVILFNKRKV